MRVLKVVALLVALGGIAGAVTGLLLFLGASLLNPGGAGAVDDLRIYGFAAGFGALVGALTGPPIALIFLRRVPLWRATMETAGAAGIGAALGLAVGGVSWTWAVSALVLAILAALRLHRSHRHRAPADAGVSAHDDA